MKIHFTLLTLFIILLCSQLYSCTGSSLPPGDAARGEKRFADASLGTNGSTCNTCHTKMGRGEKSLVGKKPFDHTIRDCIQGPLQGDPGQEQALADLMAYIETLK